MDMRSWKKVLLQWITECGFMERNYFNIEQSDIEAFYQNFSLQHPKTANGNYKRLSDFLKEFYPKFETHSDDENCISSADYIYIYSMLLHFCCVKHPETVFHEICQRLPEHAQQCIASFFKELLDNESLGKESLRHAIAHVVASHITPPRLNESFTSNLSVNNLSSGIVGAGSAGSNSSGSLPSLSFSRCDSPLKTPKRCAGPQRVSPTTPKSTLLEERTRELYNLRAQLETERYEKGILEVQIKQNEDKILKLNHDHKMLIQQIQDLKNDILLKSSDDCDSTNRDGDDQIQKRLLKDLAHKGNEINRLSDHVRTLHEEKSLVQEKLSYAEKQIVMCMNRIKDLDFKVDELTDELEKKNGTIAYLTSSKLELEQFISDNRSSPSNPTDLNGSMDCFDGSFARNIGNTNTSSNVSSPENLGASVIDVQLREKEHENSKLKEELELVKDEHKKLAKNLHDLAEKKAKEFEIIIEESLPELEASLHDETTQADPLQQFNIFCNCIEQISTYHKTEKQKLKELEDESQHLREVNKEMTQKLDTLTENLAILDDNISRVKKQNEDLLKTKQEIEICLNKRNLEVDVLKGQKHEMHIELQSTRNSNEALVGNLDDLRERFNQSQQSNNDLMDKTTMLQEQNANLLKQHQELQQSFRDKSALLELDINNLTERLAVQTEEIDIYIKAELVLKNNYEKILIENEQLKMKSREADSHLDNMKRDLMEKQTEINKFAQEIADFAQKNKALEEKIDGIMQEYQAEKLMHDKTDAELQQEIALLKDKITTIEREHQEETSRTQSQHLEELKRWEDRIQQLQSALNDTKELLVIKTQEKDEIQHSFYDVVTPKVKGILQLFEISPHEDDYLENLSNLHHELKSLLEEKEKVTTKLEATEAKLSGSIKNVQMLSNDIDQKNKVLSENQEELSRLRQQISEYEDKIEKLKEKQQQFIEKVKEDLNKKEEELSDRMQQASLEYEASLERIHVELKHEKEHHSNKERELLLVIAEHNDVKRKLNEMEQEVQKLSQDKLLLQQQNANLTTLESRSAEYAQENEQLRSEIESCKQEVYQNSMRLLEADKALNSLMAISNNQEVYKEEIQKIQETLKEKEFALQSQIKTQHDLEGQLQKQAETICNLSENLNELEQDKQRLMQDVEDYVQQVQQVQEEKTILLQSLEHSADQLKLAVEEKERQSASLEAKYHDVKQQLDCATLQNTKLQGELVERGGELRLSLEDHEQEREKFQQQIVQLNHQLAESAEQLESWDMALMEILAIMENYFNISRQTLDVEAVKNLFNAQLQQDKDTKLNQLRKNLNSILYSDNHLHSEVKELTQKLEENTKSLETSQKTANELQTKLSLQNKELAELREQVENEDEIVEKRVANEIRHLEDDLLNLEKVNERLVNGNFEMQVSMSNMEQDLKNAKSKLDKLEEEKLELKEDVCTKTKLLEKLKLEEKKLQQSLKEKTQKLETSSGNYKLLEIQQKDKSMKLQTLEKEYQELKETAAKQQQKLSQQQQQHEFVQAERKKMSEQLKQLQATNDSLETDISNKNKEILSSKNKAAELLQSLKNSQQQLEVITAKLDESEAWKLNNETKSQQMLSETQQLLRDIEFLKAQQHSASEESLRLTKEIDSLKQDKLHLREEIRDTKSDLQRANDNVTQLIQQISSIRLEKEAVNEENTLLKKQLEETGKHHSSSESKLKSIVEMSQDFERKLLTAENELKSVKANLEKSEQNVHKLVGENKKLRDSQETATKRIEKLALKLGDSQARSTKLERDNEKLAKTLEANATTVEALQKEKDSLQNEAKSLKERVQRAERAHEQLAAKVQNLELLNSQLQEIKQKLETAEIDGKSKLSKLEKMRESHEEKIRKLNNALSNAEHSNVQLNLEIGALNSQLQETKALNTQEQVQCFRQKLEASQQECLKYKELSDKLQNEVDTLKEENSCLSDQLSKLSLNLQITKDRCQQICSEMEKIRADLLITREEKSQVELQEKTFSIKLKDLETQNDNLLFERKNVVLSLEARITCLEEQLCEKSNEVDGLQQEIHSMRESSQSHASIIQQSVSANLTEFEQLQTKLSVANEALQKEQQVIAQLKLDNQILHTKYQESKQRALDATKLSEERIKENRLELEGKLEKMKNKMYETATTVGTKIGWKNRAHLCFRYFFVVVFTQIAFIGILNYFLTKNDLELIFKSNKPAVF